MTLTPPAKISDTDQPVLREGDTTVLRCASTADFLAALPFLTGFTAENSLFIVLFEGRRSGSAIRIDLPPGDTPSETEPVLDAICQLLSATGAGPEGPALVITSERSFAEARGIPWRRFAKRLERRLTREGWWVREFACVAPDGWARYRDVATTRTGRPLAEINASLVAQVADTLRETHVTLDEVGALPETDPERATHVSAELAHLTRQRAERPGSSADPLEWVRLAADNAGEAFWLSPQPLDPAMCARLLLDAEASASWLVLALTAITRPEFVVAMAAECGVERFIEAQVEDAPRALPIPRAGWSIHSLLLSLAYEPPEREKLREAIGVLTWCVAHAPREHQPGALSLLAWAWWMMGMQSVAERMADAALQIDPDHELARMAKQLNRTVPDWHLHAHLRSRA